MFDRMILGPTNKHTAYMRCVLYLATKNAGTTPGSESTQLQPNVFLVIHSLCIDHKLTDGNE